VPGRFKAGPGKGKGVSGSLLLKRRGKEKDNFTMSMHFGEKRGERGGQEGRWRLEVSGGNGKRVNPPERGRGEEGKTVRERSGRGKKRRSLFRLRSEGKKGGGGKKKGFLARRC